MTGPGLENELSTEWAKLARRKNFEAVWPSIRDELLEYLSQNNMPKEALEWYKRVRHSSLGLDSVPATHSARRRIWIITHLEVTPFTDQGFSIS